MTINIGLFQFLLLILFFNLLLFLCFIYLFKDSQKIKIPSIDCWFIEEAKVLTTASNTAVAAKNHGKIKFKKL